MSAKHHGPIFGRKMIIEKYLQMGRKLFATFMDLEESYDRVDRNGIWGILKIYGVGGHILATVSILVNGELIEILGVDVDMREGCVMSL